jgi:hypothetical protein
MHASNFVLIYRSLAKPKERESLLNLTDISVAFITRLMLVNLRVADDR